MCVCVLNTFSCSWSNGFIRINLTTDLFVAGLKLKWEMQENLSGNNIASDSHIVALERSLENSFYYLFQYL